MNIKKSFLIATVYVLFRFLEMKFIEREEKPIKYYFKDGLIVFLSVALATMALSPNSPIKSLFGLDLGKHLGLDDNDYQTETQPPVFTNQPEF